MASSDKLVRETGAPPDAATSSRGRERKLEIAVICTSPRGTTGAIHAADRLLTGLDGRILLIDAQPIAYALPLDRPPVSLDFSRRRVWAMIKESTVEIAATVVLCRSRFETLVRVLQPDSIVVIGYRYTWWPSWAAGLARKLQRVGYQVVVQKV